MGTIAILMSHTIIEKNNQLRLKEHEINILNNNIINITKLYYYQIKLNEEQNKTLKTLSNALRLQNNIHSK